MPQEVINPRVIGSYQTRVGWMRDGAAVQVGLSVDGDRSLLWQLYGQDEIKAHLGSLVFDLFQEVVDWPEHTTREVADRQHRDLAERVLNILDVAAGGPPPQQSDDGVDQLGEPVTDRLAFSGYSGVWSDLSRADVNEMIRVLRRARDQAFGRDE